jgi:hypothetical protein
MKSPIRIATEMAKKQVSILLRNTKIGAMKRACGEGYLYLATVYSQHSKGIHVAFEDAARAAAWFLEKGVTVFCPIAHTHPIAVHGNIDPLDHSIWIPMDKPFMSAANGLIVAKMPGWEKSKGIAIEIAEFEKAGKPIFYVEWPLPE